jgi:hypothetical protein
MSPLSLSDLLVLSRIITGASSREIADCSALRSEILDSSTLPALLEAVSDSSALPRLLEAEEVKKQCIIDIEL